MSLSQRSLLAEQTRIQFVPDPHSIGIDNPNFTRFSDAVAEFIDNSIQACCDSRLEIPPLLTQDNSNNQTSKRLINVSIYLNQSNKGFLVISDHGNGMDSNGLRNFATFALSKEFRGERPKSEFDRTFIGKFGVGAKQGGFFLGDRIKTITKSSTAHERDPWLCFILDAEELLQRQRNQQNVYEGFITPFRDLNYVLAEDEKENVDLLHDLTRHLAHDSDQGAVFIIRLKSHVTDFFRKNQNCHIFERELADIHYFHLHPEQRPSHQAGRRLITSSQLTTACPAFEVHFQVYRPGHHYRSNFSQVQSFPLQCFALAKASLPFVLTVPVTGDANRSFDISGIVQYFPFQEGQETRPLLLDIEDNADSTTIFRVFWQDRALPEAKVSNLPFFPGIRDLSRLVDNGVASKWRSRLVVFLFLDWDFQNISNNKLKITQADFETQLMTLKNSIMYHPSTLKKDFEKWLEESSKAFDQEFRFFDRLLDLTESRHMIFRKVLLLGRGGEYGTGAKISITNTQTKEKVFASIQDFLVKEHLPFSESSFTGTGILRYKRIPDILFGDKVFEANMSKIELSTVSSAELAAFQLESKPTSIKLYLVEPEKLPMEVSSVTSLRCSVKYSFGVHLARNKNKDTFFPEKAKEFVYGVTISLATSPDTELSRNNNITVFGDGSDTAVNKKSKTKLIVLPDITFNVAGKIQLLVRVFSNDFSQQLVEKVIDIKCVTTAPKRFQASFHGFEGIPPIRLGSTLPAITLELVDAHDNIISYDGEIKISVSCESLTINGGECRRTIAHRTRIPENHWTITPKTQRTHLFEVSKDGIASRIVSLTFTASVRTTTTGNAQTDDWKSVKGCILDIELFPGLPSGLRLIDIDKLNVKPPCEVRDFTMGCVDMWGNPTARTHRLSDISYNLSVMMESNGPLTSTLGDAQTVWALEINGEAHINNLQCRETIFSVLETTQTFHLKNVETQENVGEPLNLSVVLLPTTTPSILQLLFEDNVIDEQFEYKVVAGGVVKGIGYRILDENNQVLDIAPYRALHNSHLTIAMYPDGKSNNAKKRQISLPETDAINAVKASKVKGLHFMEISFTLAGSTPLQQILAIRVDANTPTAWKIKTSSQWDEGLLLQNPDDFASKLEYVYCVDEFDNVACLPNERTLLQDLRMKRLSASGTQTQNLSSSLFSEHLLTQQQSQKPVLRIRSATNKNESDDVIIELVRKVAVEEESDNNSSSSLNFISETDMQIRYMPLPGACIVGFAPESTIHITAESAMNSGLEAIADHTVTACIVGGEPASLRLFSLAYDLVGHTTKPSFSMEMSQLEKLEDLEICVLDEHGGPASSLWTRKMSIAIYFNESVLYSKKNIRNNPIYLQDFNFSAASFFDCNHNNSPSLVNIAIDVVVGGGINGKEVKKLSTSLEIKFVPSNHVIDLQLFSLSKDIDDSKSDGPGEASLTLVAGQPLPEIFVGVIAADNKACDIDNSSIKVYLRPTSCRDSVKISDVSEEKCLNLSDIIQSNCYAAVRAVIINNFNPKQIAGKFTLEARYEESRPTLASLPAELRQKSTKLPIQIVHAEFHTLVLDERRINRDVLHSSLDKENVFSSMLTVQMRDKFRNIIPVDDDHFLVCCIMPNECQNGLLENICKGTFSSHTSCQEYGPPLAVSNFNVEDSHGLFYDHLVDENETMESPSSQLLSSQNEQLSGSKRRLSQSDASDMMPKKIRRVEVFSESKFNKEHRQRIGHLLTAMGAVVAQRHPSGQSFVFENLQLKNTIDNSFLDGPYILRFSLIHIIDESEDVVTLKEENVPIEYCSAATVEFRSRQIITVGDQAQAELDDYNGIREKKRDLNDELETIVSELQKETTMLAEKDASFPTLAHLDKPSIISLNELATTVQKIYQEKAKEDVRSAVKSSKALRHRLPEDAVGYVVDLAYVEDKRDAQVLSWAAGTWMDTVIVHREAVAIDLYRRQQRRAWAFETAGNFNNSGGNHNRQKCLPLLERFSHEMGGRPRFMIDVLQFDSCREELRMTLFSHIYQNIILIDTLEHAMDFRREWLRTTNQRAPTIYTLQGDRVPASGLLDPTSKLPSDLQTVFGSQDPKDIFSAHARDKILFEIERCKNILSELTEIESKLRMFDVDDLEQKIRAADVEKRRLRI